MFLCLKFLPHTATYQRFKVHCKLYFLYGTYCLVVIIYHFYYSSYRPACFYQAVCVPFFTLQVIRWEERAPHRPVHLCTIQTSASSLCEVRGRCQPPLISRAVSSTLRFANTFLTDLLENLMAFGDLKIPHACFVLF